MKRFYINDFKSATDYVRIRRLGKSGAFINSLRKYLRMEFQEQLELNSLLSLDYDNFTFFFGCLVNYRQLYKYFQEIDMT